MLNIRFFSDDRQTLSLVKISFYSVNSLSFRRSEQHSKHLNRLRRLLNESRKPNCRVDKALTALSFTPFHSKWSEFPQKSKGNPQFYSSSVNYLTNHILFRKCGQGKKWQVTKRITQTSSPRGLKRTFGFLKNLTIPYKPFTGKGLSQYK